MDENVEWPWHIVVSDACVDKDHIPALGRIFDLITPMIPYDYDIVKKSSIRVAYCEPVKEYWSKVSQLNQVPNCESFGII